MSELSIGTANFYRHSGKAPILGLILIGIVGLIVTPILGVIYGYLLWYIPFVYINFFVVLGYAFGIGLILSKMAKTGKIRNMFLLGLAGLFFGLLAEYIGWVSWLAALVGDPAFMLEFFYPFDIVYIITEIAKEGVWSVSGVTPSGGSLYLIWFLEACMVIGIITYSTVSSLSKVPFCEDSDTWTERKGVIAAFAPITDKASFKAAIEQGSYSKFNELQPAGLGNKFTIIELYECPTCKNFQVINVKDLTITRDNKGRQNNKEKAVVSNLIATPGILGNILRVAETHKSQSSEPSAS